MQHVASEGALRRGRPGNEAVVVLPYRGDEVVHSLEHGGSCELAPCRYQGSPPILAGEGVLRANEGNWLLLNHDRRVGLGLPGGQLHRGRGDFEGIRVRVLEITETSTGPKLESNDPTDERVHRVDPGLRS